MPTVTYGAMLLLQGGLTAIGEVPEAAIAREEPQAPSAVISLYRRC